MDRRVVLVYPYFRDRDPVSKLFLPLGLAYLASQLRQQRVEVSVIDCTFENPDSAVKKIISLKPAIVGISIMVSLEQNSFGIAAQVRQALPKTILAAGGALPSVNPNRYLALFDLVFKGESDLIFAGFCRDYLAAGMSHDFLERIDVKKYPGIHINTGKGIVSSAAVHHGCEILNNLPKPDRSDFPHDLYQRHWKSLNQASQANIMVTRGCPFSCDFCSKPVWGSVYRKLDLRKVFQEIEDIVELGYERLWIADDSFTLEPAYLKEFCQRKLSRKIDIEWTCLSRTRGVDRETLDLMREAGCVKVYLGLESGSDATLRLMGKNSTVQDGINAVTMLTEAGIDVSGFFMVGYPGETIASIEKTLSLALSLPLEEISINVPLPLPGSSLYSKVRGLNSDDDWEKASAMRFLYESEFDNDWLRMRINETLANFKKGKSKQPTYLK